MPKKISDINRFTNYFMTAPVDEARAILETGKAILEAREASTGRSTEKPAGTRRSRRAGLPTGESASGQGTSEA